MPSTPLPNYLRAHRKRIGLSQQDLAFLLGCRSGAKVSRYERFSRQPGLTTVFACTVIFGVRADELFAGSYHTAAREVARRASALIVRLTKRPDSPIQRRKITFLRTVEGATAAARKGQPCDRA
jgi:transcriptional regulator with XRE-family HTH domain